MPQLKLPSMSSHGFELVFGYLYTGLAVNVSMVIANAPLAAAVLLVRDPASAWPFFLLLSPTLAPSLAGAFGAFEAHAFGDGGGVPAPFAAFWRAWLRSVRPALAVGVALGALLLLVGLDLSGTAGTAAGALVAPVLLLAAALGVAVALLVLTGLALRPADDAASLSLGALVKASVYLALRRAPISLLSLAAVAGACVFVLAQPVLGAMLGVAPLLFVAFGNSRATLALLSAVARVPAQG